MSTYKNIAVVSAMEIEISYVEALLKERPGWKKTNHDTYFYEPDKIQLHTRILGVGKVNAAYQTADLINELSVDLIINVGYAGGLVKGAKKGELAIGNAYVQADFLPYKEENRLDINVYPKEAVRDMEKTASKLGIKSYTGRIATGDFFLHDSRQKKEIIERYKAIAFDMESAAVAQVAAAKMIDFVALRIFSDMADDDAVDAIFDIDPENQSRIPIEQRPIVVLVDYIEHKKPCYLQENH